MTHIFIDREIIVNLMQINRQCNINSKNIERLKRGGAKQAECGFRLQPGNSCAQAAELP